MMSQAEVPPDKDFKCIKGLVNPVRRFKPRPYPPETDDEGYDAQDEDEE